MEFETLNELLVWVAGPAGTAACFVYVSNLVRNLREEGKLAEWSSWAVQLLTVGLSLAGPVAAYLVITYVPQDIIGQLQPFYGMIGALASSYLIQQGWYKLTKNDSAGGNAG